MSKNEITKKWIADNMKKLMLNKTIDQIRITEICQLSGVERSTFYYHFEDKYALVAYIYFDIIAKANLLDKQQCAHVFREMKKDFLFFKNAYSDVSQNSLWNYMIDYSYSRYQVLAKQKLGVDTLSKSTLLSIRFFSYGTSGLSKEWFLNDSEMSAEEIVKILFDNIPAELSTIFELKNKN